VPLGGLGRDNGGLNEVLPPAGARPRLPTPAGPGGASPTRTPTDSCGSTSQITNLSSHAAGVVTLTGTLLASQPLLLDSHDRLGQVGLRHVRVAAHAGPLRALNQLGPRRLARVDLGAPGLVSPGTGTVRGRFARAGLDGLALAVSRTEAAFTSAPWEDDSRSTNSTLYRSSGVNARTPCDGHEAEVHGCSWSFLFPP
jgi:hypothetical protein